MLICIDVRRAARLPKGLSGGSDSPRPMGLRRDQGQGRRHSLSGCGGNDWLYGGWGSNRIGEGAGQIIPSADPATTRTTAERASTSAAGRGRVASP